MTPAAPPSAHPAALAAGALASGVLLGLLPAMPAQAGPVVCTTTLEAPLAGTGNSTRPPSAPVEVTRCGEVQTTAELFEQRAYTWRSTFARGVSLTNQITDILGIAMGGPQGNRVMGFGFPEQAIVWDSSAIGNTTAALLEEQSAPMPFRDTDLPSIFSSSLQVAPTTVPVQVAQPGVNDFPTSFPVQTAPVRGLW
ncbi:MULTISPECIES: occludin/ELL family protein [unclassified Synechococcus]|uniref:occludin/ELL family protein n=1 Tax=Synechococcales TaxID=1890424 RepID=UPI002107D3DC|nr:MULTISPECIES: occludin/ELL family protein [unclassified Synechococcus]